MNKGVKIAIAIVSATGLSVGGYYGYRYIKYYNLKRTRKIVINDTSNFTAADKIFNINVPAFDTQFYKDSDVAAIDKKIDTIKNNYGDIVSIVSKATNIPEEIIYSFIFIESAGNQNARNDKSYGLMQVSTVSATEILNMENRKGNLSDLEKQILVKNLGQEKVNKIFKLKRGEPVFIVTAEDLKNPELNILIGCIYLSALIDDNIKKFGTLKMEYVIAGYNIGYYGAKKLLGKAVNTFNNTTKQYVYKMLGKNGVLSILKA